MKEQADQKYQEAEAMTSKLADKQNELNRKIGIFNKKCKDHEEAVAKFEEDKSNQKAIVKDLAEKKAESKQKAFLGKWGFCVAMLGAYGFLMSVIVGYLQNAFKGDLSLFYKFSGYLSGLTGIEWLGELLALAALIVLGIVLYKIEKGLDPDRTALLVALYSFGICLCSTYTVTTWLVINIAFNAIFERETYSGYYHQKVYEQLLEKLPL